MRQTERHGGAARPTHRKAVDLTLKSSFFIIFFHHLVLRFYSKCVFPSYFGIDCSTPPRKEISASLRKMLLPSSSSSSPPLLQLLCRLETSPLSSSSAYRLPMKTGDALETPRGGERCQVSVFRFGATYRAKKEGVHVQGESRPELSRESSAARAKGGKRIRSIRYRLFEGALALSRAMDRVSSTILVDRVRMDRVVINC